MTFTLFTSSNCTGQPIDINPDRALTGGAALSGQSPEIMANGARSYRVTYSGDLIYEPVTVADAHCESVIFDLNVAIP